MQNVSDGCCRCVPSWHALHTDDPAPLKRSAAHATQLLEPAPEPPEASEWEPVITRLDPMTAGEWRAELECEPAEWTDPEEYPDEEDYLDPGALDLTDAELAEIAAATRCSARAAGQAAGAQAAGAQAAGAADDADPAGVADAYVPGVAGEGEREARTVAAIT